MTGFPTRRRICAIPLLALFCLAAQAQTLRQRPGHLRHEIATGQAQRLGPLAPEQALRLSLVLPLRNTDELLSLLRQIYDPSSPDYRRFLSPEEFAQRFAPTSDEIGAVEDFARSQGFDVAPACRNRLLIPISGTVEQIQNAFHVRLSSYALAGSRQVFFAPDREPAVDAALPIFHVVGLNNFANPQPLVRQAAAPGRPRADTVNGSAPDRSYLASDMRAAYYGESALTGAGQTVALVEFDGYRRSDVDLTLSSAGQASSVLIQNVLLDGMDSAPARTDDAEPVLDIVQAIGMAPGLSAVRLYIGSSDADILNAIASENIARQVAISWTWSPDDPAVDDEFFLEMAAQGQSVFAASGDHGAFDPVMQDFYPAEDAWVTAVGGTHLTTSGAGGAWSGESAWLYSGGGISPDGIALPPWQTGVATAENGASTTLRNVPDVAMEGDFDNYLCVMGICSGQWAGTSFAAARWAGFAALANEQAVETGAPPLGFVNPTLYAIAQDPPARPPLHDIVSGDNNAENGCCGQRSFNAVAGYDLVTGWGSPAGPALIDALASPAAPAAGTRVSPAAVSIAPGASVQVTLTIVAEGALDLSVSGVPAGVTAKFSDNPAQASSRLFLTADATALRGDWLLRITGSSGAIAASATLALHIEAPGFTLAPSAPSITLYPGSSVSDTLVISALDGFNAPVSFAVTSDLPAGITASWLNQPSTGSAELTLTADSGASPNHSMITVTGVAGELASTATIAVAVNPPQFLLDLSPYPLALAQGDVAQSSIGIVPVGSFVGSVDLSAPQLPQGVSATFSPAAANPTSSVVLSAGDTAPTGHWPAAIAGSSGSLSTAVQFTQAILPAGTPGFVLAASPAFARLRRGDSAVFKMMVIGANGFSSPVSLAAANLPAGISAAWSGNPVLHSVTLTLRADSTAPAAAALPVVLEGTSGVLTSQAVVYIGIDPDPSFALLPSPTALLLAPGGTASATFSVLPQAGFSAPVSASILSPLPHGVSATLTPQSGSVALRLAADASAVPGAFLLIVAGTAGGQSVTASIAVRIAPAAPAVPQMVALSPAFAAAGSTGFSLTILGSGFTTASVAYWNGLARTTRYVSPTEIVAQIDSTDLGHPGTAGIAISQADAAGALSNSLHFEIDSAPSPAYAPAFASASATVSPGRAAVYPVSFPADANPLSVACLNLPAGSSCSWSSASAALTIVTAGSSPAGTFAVTAVFTESQAQSSSAAVLLPLLLLPLAFFRRTRDRLSLRIFHVLCLAIILAGLMAACGSLPNSGSIAPAASPGPTFTSSGVVSLTIQ